MTYILLSQESKMNMKEKFEMISIRFSVMEMEISRPYIKIIENIVQSL